MCIRASPRPTAGLPTPNPPPPSMRPRSTDMYRFYYAFAKEFAALFNPDASVQRTCPFGPKCAPRRSLALGL
eukprot:1304286-Prymnesium_polylepis.1